MIRKIVIRNYRKFRQLDIDMLPSTNILVGSNDSGKSTLIEAINLALTGKVNGRLFAQELSPYYINQSAAREYVEALQSNLKTAPPSIIIEVYLNDGGEAEILRGTNNLLGEDACGIRMQAKLSPDFEEEYRCFVANPASIRLVPTEYYRVDWVGFSGNGVTARSVPATASVVDPSSIRLQSGGLRSLPYLGRRMVFFSDHAMCQAVPTRKGGRALLDRGPEFRWESGSVRKENGEPILLG